MNAKASKYSIWQFQPEVNGEIERYCSPQLPTIEWEVQRLRSTTGTRLPPETPPRIGRGSRERPGSIPVKTGRGTCLQSRRIEVLVISEIGVLIQSKRRNRPILLSATTAHVRDAKTSLVDCVDTPNSRGVPQNSRGVEAAVVQY